MFWDMNQIIGGSARRHATRVNGRKQTRVFLAQNLCSLSLLAGVEAIRSLCHLFGPIPSQPNAQASASTTKFSGRFQQNRRRQTETRAEVQNVPEDSTVRSRSAARRGSRLLMARRQAPSGGGSAQPSRVGRAPPTLTVASRRIVLVPEPCRPPPPLANSCCRTGRTCGSRARCCPGPVRAFGADAAARALLTELEDARVATTWIVMVEAFCMAGASWKRRSTDGEPLDHDAGEDGEGSARRIFRVRPPGAMTGRRIAAPGRACGSSATYTKEIK